MQGLEPWASCSQSRRATNCATPRYEVRRPGWAYSPKSVSRGKGELVVTEPKTENSVREIYLSDEAIRLLVEDRKNHPFSPYMFPSPKTGGMYGPDCVGRIHKKLLEKAGIEEHVRFHDLRHTFSTLAIQSGIDPKTVAEILGHASAEFSLDVYAAI